MTKINDGGSAFPRSPIGEDCNNPYGYQDGLTKRDWFAGKALTALLGNDLMLSRIVNAKGGLAADHSDVAHICYEIADAMIAARGDA